MAHGLAFAETPPILRGSGPQMENYPDWDSWLFARRVWAMARMGIDNPRMKEAADKMRVDPPPLETQK